MNAITFDSLSFSQQLKAGGFSETQAETLAHAMQHHAGDDHLVTKDFLRSELERLDEKWELRSEKTELRLTVKFGSMIFMLGGLLVAIKYFG